MTRFFSQVILDGPAGALELSEQAEAVPGEA
jgi:hypothetical protein